MKSRSDKAEKFRRTKTGKSWTSAKPLNFTEALDFGEAPGLRRSPLDFSAAS